MASIDTDLLFWYGESGRTRGRDIAKLLNKSPQRIKYTVRALERDGILKDAYCIFDYSFFGLILFRIYFKGGYINQKNKAEIIKKLSENNYIISIYELNGEFDLGIEIVSPNPSRLNKELKHIANEIPTLNNYKAILNIVTHIYPRHYMVKDYKLLAGIPKEIIIGGDRKIQSFTEDEMLVMKSILEKPKIRMTALANACDMNTKTAAKIFKSLQQKKVIRGFKHIIDTDELGIHNFRLFLKLHNVSHERENDLMNFILNTKEFIQLNKTVGDWDIEIDTEAFSKTKIRELLIRLREEFKDIIETFNIIEFYKYYRRAYLPSYLFMPEQKEQKELQIN